MRSVRVRGGNTKSVQIRGNQGRSEEVSDQRRLGYIKRGQEIRGDLLRTRYDVIDAMNKVAYTYIYLHSMTNVITLIPQLTYHLPVTFGHCMRRLLIKWSTKRRVPGPVRLVSEAGPVSLWFTALRCRYRQILPSVTYFQPRKRKSM